MKILKTLICFLVLTGSVSLKAQTAEKIIDDYITAVGGVKNWEAIKSMKILGKVSAQGMEMPMVQYVKEPGKIRQEFTMQGMTMIQSFDGTSGWKVFPFMGSTAPEKMNEEEIKSLKEQSDFSGSLMKYKERGDKVEFIGTEDMEGVDVNIVRLTKKDSMVETYYFDSETKLILKQVVKFKMENKEMSSETYFSDYKEINGIKMSHSIESKMDGMVVAQVSFDTVEINGTIDDKIFEMPAVEGQK